MNKTENYYLITGSSSGLGEALSKQLQQSGFNTLGIDKTDGKHTNINIDLSNISNEHVLEIRNYLNGKKIDLTGFSNEDQYFVVRKNHEGKEVTFIERPGLWNGSMCYWNTIFIEIPSETFTPVKTVLDLLKPAHQPH